MTVAVAEPDAPEDDATRPSPSDVGAEAAMLSAVLVVGQTDTAAAHQLVDDLATVVEPGDMWHTGHFLLWQVLIDATALGDPVDPASVSSRLLATGNPRARETAQQVLPNLLGRLAASGSATHHARKVAQCAVRRRLIETGTQLVQRAHQDTFDEAHDVPPVMAALEQATAGHGTTTATPVGQILERAVDLIENPEHVEVIPSGLHDLDFLLPGLAPGQLVVIAASTGIGKSLLALTWARQAALRLRKRTILYSLEMTKVEVTQRLLAAEASVEIGRVKAGGDHVTEADWLKIVKAMERVHDAPLDIDDTAEIGLPQIRAAVRRACRRTGPDRLALVVVDYLQLMQTPRSDSRREALDAVARGLKTLAMECQVSILAVAQLNRGPEQRTDKRPVMSDIREFGGLENDASAVILIHRPEKHDRDERPGEADLILAKHRDGPTGVASVAFRGHYARLDSMTGWDA